MKECDVNGHKVLLHASRAQCFRSAAVKLRDLATCINAISTDNLNNQINKENAN